MSTRRFDIIILGASGFTGKLVLQHALNYYKCISPSTAFDSTKENKEILPATNEWRDNTVLETEKEEFRFKILDNVPTKLKVGIAGRNFEKLHECLNIAKSKVNSNDMNDDCIIEVDVRNYDKLVEMTKQTKVLVTTVGPYLLHGELVVKACAETGTHYCDLTGELPFISKMERLYSNIAKGNKCKIVHCCGLDSIPNDIGVLLLEEYSIRKYNRPCDQIDFRWVDFNGGFSGGSIASGINLLKYEPIITEKEQEILSSSIFKIPIDKSMIYDPYKLMRNSAAMVNDTSKQTKHAIETPQDQIRFYKYDSNSKRYLAPFIMSIVNSNVVMLSNYMLNFKYGSSFFYTESLDLGFTNFLSAGCIGLGLYFLTIMKKLPFLIYLYEKFAAPLPGTGPSENILSTGYFAARIVGKISSEKKEITATVFSNQGDPGYHETAKMIFECAVSLVLNESYTSQQIYGTCTPASGIGLILADRLNNVGVKFSISNP